MEFKSPLNNGYTIYSKSGCTYCDKAKLLLKDEVMIVISCDEYLIDSKDKFLEFISSIAKKEYKSFPMIFKDANFIGGYSDLLKCLKEDWNSN